MTLANRYRIEARLGRGGQALVYRARDLTVMSKPVVVKILSVAAGQNAWLRKKFHQEMEALSRIDHPGVVGILDTGELPDGTPFLVIQYVEGVTLRQAMEGGVIEPGRAAAILRQIGAALETAHAIGVAHRDLKPENIMLQRLGDGGELVKLIDFGIAKVEKSALRPNTTTAMVAGTVRYMAPEQFRGENSSASDIYSLGRIACEMISGRPEMEALPRRVSRRVRDLIRSALAYRSQDRPAKADTLCNQLADALANARDVSLPRRAAMAGAALAALAVVLLLVTQRLTLPVLSAGWWRASKRPSTGSLRLTSLERVKSDAILSAYPRLSPDSKWIVYSSDRGGKHNLNLWRQNTGGGEPIHLTKSEDDDIDPDISADGRYIAFQSTRKPEGVYLVPAAGGEARLVALFARSPRFSPDGRRLAYWVRDPQTSFGTVYIALAEESLPEGRRVAREFDDAHDPIWTADGRHLLFCGTRRTRGGLQEEHDLWVAPIEAGAATKTHSFAYFAQARLNAHSRLLAATSFQLHNGDLILAAESGERVNLWRLPLSANWHAAGPPERLTEGTHSELHPAVGRGGLLSFTSATSNIDLWSLPLDAERARVTGKLGRLTESPAEDFSPSISLDGERLVFLSRRSGALSVWKKELFSGVEIEMARPEPSNRVKISPDGQAAFYRVLEGDGIQRQPIYRVDLRSGQIVRICPDCGVPTGASPLGDRVVFETGHALPRLAEVVSATGEKRELLRHPRYAVRSGRVSPDGAWLAFQLDRGFDGKQIMVAAFRDGAPVPPSEWREITEPTGISQEPWWSPGARYVYYLSDRDGYRCVWAQALSSRTKRPSGSPVLIYHFHGARLTPLTFVDRAPSYVGLSVARNRLVLSLSEVTGALWTARLWN
jgi:serine/threonine protein kinase